MSQILTIATGLNVATIRMDDKPTRNALDASLMRELADILERVDIDTSSRCIVIAGTDEQFATGADIRVLTEPGANQALRHETAEFWNRFRAIRTPIVAAVSGWALGPGCELALACDMVVASDRAEFGLPEVTLGLIPGGGATQQLARTIGKQRTMELILTGRRFDADQAYAWGLVNARTKKQNWLQEAQDLAARIAARAPAATRLGKQAVLSAERELFDEAVETERSLLEEAMKTEDRIEAVNAIIASRPPQFEDR